MNWLDWAIIGVVAINALAGARRGLFRTVVRFLSHVGSLIGAFLLTRPVSALLDARFGLTAKLTDFIGRFISLPADFARTTVTGLSTGELWTMLDKTGLPEQYKDAVMTWMAGAAGNAAVTLERFIQESLGMLALSVLTFIGLMIAIQVAVHLVVTVIYGATDLSGNGGIDTLAGLALGAAQGVLIAALILGLGLPLLSMSSMGGVASALEASRLAPHLLGAFYTVAPWLRQIGQALWERFR